MLNEITAALRWSTALSKRFLHIYPQGIICAVVLTFLAQLALIASLLLPLKIVMIMSSGRIPGMLPEALTQLGEKPLIVGISVLAIGAFLFNNIANRLIENIASRGANKLQAATNKLALFENQDAIAQSAMLKVSAIWASVIFVSAGLIILSKLYALLAAVIACFILLCLSIYSLAWDRSLSLKNAVEKKFGQHLNMLGNIGFLIVFSAIVVDYMVNSIPGFLSVLLSIILSRQIFSQLTTAIISIHQIQSQQHKLKALAFEQHVLKPATKKARHTVWGFLENSAQKKSIYDYVEKSLGLPMEPGSLKWLDSGISNILHFTIEASNGNKYLIKIFDKNKSAKAKHEASLLLDPPQGLPAPPMVDAGYIRGFHVHVFDVSNYKLVKGVVAKKQLNQLKLQLATINPSKELINQYQRSRPMLWDRIDQDMIFRIFSTQGNFDSKAFNEFSETLPEIKHALRNSHLRIYKRMRKKEVFYTKSNKDLASADWCEWAIEPSVKSYGQDKDTHNGESLNKSCELHQIELARRCLRLEKEANAQNYSAAKGIATQLARHGFGRLENTPPPPHQH